MDLAQDAAAGGVLLPRQELGETMFVTLKAWPQLSQLSCCRNGCSAAGRRTANGRSGLGSLLMRVNGPLDGARHTQIFGLGGVTHGS